MGSERRLECCRTDIDRRLWDDGLLQRSVLHTHALMHKLRGDCAAHGPVSLNPRPQTQR